MRYIYNYVLFNEARFSDIYKTICSGFTYNNSSDYSDNFIKFKTIQKRTTKNKIRLNIFWNDTITHDLKNRIEKRTNLKNIKELNYLLSSGLEEIYSMNYGDFSINGKYSFWFSEYNFSIIVTKKDNDIRINTILPGMNSNNVLNVIELKITI